MAPKNFQDLLSANCIIDDVVPVQSKGLRTNTANGLV